MFSLRRKFYYSDSIKKSDIRITIILFIVTSILLSVGYYGNQKSKESKYYSGVVVRKYEDRLKDKSGNDYRVDKYFLVKFDSIDKPISILVIANTYYAANVNERVVFKMNKFELHKDNFVDFLYALCLLVGGITGICFFSYFFTNITILIKDYEIVYTGFDFNKFQKKKKNINENEWWLMNSKK